MKDYQKSFHWNKVNIWSDKLLSYTEVEISSFLTKFSSQAALEISSAAVDEYYVNMMTFLFPSSDTHPDDNDCVTDLQTWSIPIINTHNRITCNTMAYWL